MTKKNFISLADAIRQANNSHTPNVHFTTAQLEVLAGFCKSQNSAFKSDRWFGYIAGENGPNGGTIKAEYEYQVHGRYNGEYEEVTAEDNKTEAEARLKEYQENEPETTFRIFKVKI